MKSDFEDNTFDRHKHFSRVLVQQGRVQTAADSNEQDDILLHYLRTLAADLIGPHGGPFSEKPGFEIEPGFKIVLLFTDQGAISDLCISHGRYYVDGLLCENGGEAALELVTYYDQPDYPLDKNRDPLPYRPFLVYLDVWERHITAIEDPDIREVALGVGGPDTATRAKLVWQVKTTDEVPDGSDFPVTRDGVEAYWNQWVEQWQPTNRGKLKAKAEEDPDKDTDPCIISPEARYRGVENQLYRVEIHESGAATQQEATGYEQGDGTNGGVATFKWSRDNGSVAIPIRDLDGTTVTLEHLGRDSRLSLKVGDLVEIEDDDYVLQGRAEPLLRIEAIDPITMQVTLNKEPFSNVGQDLAKHPLLRRWDHGEGDSKRGELEQDTGTFLVEEGTWLELEDGVQIYFQPATEPGIMEYTIQEDENLTVLAQRIGTTVEELLCLNPYIQNPDLIFEGRTLKMPDGTDEDTSAYHRYRTGDYWLIPARTATGDVDWPGEVGQPEARPPHGIEHHYAPLAVVVSAANTADNPVDCRYKYIPLRECCGP
jgi:hypothetical protein